MRRHGGVALQVPKYSLPQTRMFQEQMEMQAHEFPNLVIPWIQATLMKLILEMGGEKTEGLFRIGADQDQMATGMP